MTSVWPRVSSGREVRGFMVSLSTIYVVVKQVPRQPIPRIPQVSTTRRVVAERISASEGRAGLSARGVRKARPGALYLRAIHVASMPPSRPTFVGGGCTRRQDGPALRIVWEEPLDPQLVHVDIERCPEACDRPQQPQA